MNDSERVIVIAPAVYLIIFYSISRFTDVAAVGDQNNRVLDSEFFATTRQGYRKMLAWMSSFGTIERIGVECTGSYGAGLLRYLQSAKIEVLEVTVPDKMERRKRGKSDTIDAESAAHAALCRIRTVTSKTRSGMIEALRVLKVCRKTAVAARRIALQMIQMNIVSAPNELRDQIRHLTRMHLIRTLVRRYLELHDEIADLDVMITSIADELAPVLISRKAIGYECASQLLITAGDNPQRLTSECGLAALCGVSPVPVSSGKQIATDLTAVVIVPPIAPYILLLLGDYVPIRKHRNMSPDG